MKMWHKFGAIALSILFWTWAGSFLIWKYGPLPGPFAFASFVTAVVLIAVHFVALARAFP